MKKLIALILSICVACARSMLPRMERSRTKKKVAAELSGDMVPFDCKCFRVIHGHSKESCMAAWPKSRRSVAHEVK